MTSSAGDWRSDFVRVNIAMMSKAKAKPVETEEPVEVVEELEELPPEEGPATAERPAGPMARKPLGVKEVPQFKWKLIGRSAGLWLTLYKSVEQDDSQAQLERLRREGYYGELQVVDINAKVEQNKTAQAKAEKAEKPEKVARPKAPPAAPKSVPFRLAPAPPKPKKEKAAAAAKPKTSKKAAPAAAAKKKAAAKPAAKPAAKAPAKKAAKRR